MDKKNKLVRSSEGPRIRKHVGKTPQEKTEYAEMVRSSPNAGSTADEGDNRSADATYDESLSPTSRTNTPGGTSDRTRVPLPGSTATSHLREWIAIGLTALLAFTAAVINYTTMRAKVDEHASRISETRQDLGTLTGTVTQMRERLSRAETLLSVVNASAETVQRTRIEIEQIKTQLSDVRDRVDEGKNPFLRDLERRVTRVEATVDQLGRPTTSSSKP